MGFEASYSLGEGGGRDDPDPAAGHDEVGELSRELFRQGAVAAGACAGMLLAFKLVGSPHVSSTAVPARKSAGVLDSGR